MPGKKYTNKNQPLNKRQARQAASIAKKAIHKTFELKKKFDEQSETIVTTAATTPLQNHITQISLGDNVSQREGNKVLAKKVTVKGYVHSNSTETPILCRVVIARLKDASFLTNWNNGVDVFENNNGDIDLSPAGSSLDIYRNFNMDRLSKVYFDKVINLGISNNDAARVRQFSKVIKFPFGLPVEYSDDSSGSVTKNPLSVWFIARGAPNDTGVIPAQVEVTWNAVLHYLDV